MHVLFGSLFLLSILYWSSISRRQKCVSLANLWWNVNKETTRGENRVCQGSIMITKSACLLIA